MRKTYTGVIVSVAGAVLLSALAAAQSNEARSPWKYYPEDARANKGDGGPAPKRDLTGTWAEISGACVERSSLPKPPRTRRAKGCRESGQAEGASVVVAIRTIRTSICAVWFP